MTVVKHSAYYFNGTLTIGTLDGANIEIREQVGKDHIFIFGNNTDQALAQIATGTFNPGEPQRYTRLFHWSTLVIIINC